MDKDFGQRLRELRLAKGLTKEDFCGDEAELCVRQLTRWETGKAKPGMDKLTLLASKLDMTVSELIGEAEPPLPEDYLKLKYQLIHTPSYDNLEVLEELDKKLDFIYENYYDGLPSEEQMIVSVLQSKVYSYSSDTHQKYGMKMFERYKSTLCQNRVYGMNDLILLQLYQIFLGGSEEIQSVNFDKQMFHQIAHNLLNSKKAIKFESLFLLRDALFTIPAVEHERREFRYTKQALVLLNQIMEETQDYQKKSILRMMEAQYLYFVEHDYEQADLAYQEAAMLARLLGNNYLADKIMEEKEKDFEN